MELHRGKKSTHWMWFIFPQVNGLGHSAMAKRFAIRSRGEGSPYLAHPILRTWLRECTALVLEVPWRSAHDIFGSPDDMKFHSSMTLFGALEGDALFGNAIERFYGAKPDAATLEIMKSWQSPKSKKMRLL